MAIKVKNLLKKIATSAILNSKKVGTGNVSASNPQKKEPTQAPTPGQPKLPSGVNLPAEASKMTTFPEPKNKMVIDAASGIGRYGTNVLNKNELQAFDAMQRGEGLGRFKLEQSSLDKILSIRDQMAAERALLPEPPKGISNQRQLDIYNKLIEEENKGKEAEVMAAAQREAAKPTEGLPLSENPMQTAGFIGAGLAGETGTIAGVGGALLAAGAVPTPATPALLTGGIVAIAIAGGKSWLASKSKTRAQDITTARSTSAYAMKQINVVKARAAQPGADINDVMADYYAYKRQIYSAEAVLSDPELIDQININEGLDELARIKAWMANEEDSLDDEIFARLSMGGNAEIYAAEMPSAIQALNGEQQ